MDLQGSQLHFACADTALLLPSTYFAGVDSDSPGQPVKSELHEIASTSVSESDSGQPTAETIHETASNLSAAAGIPGSRIDTTVQAITTATASNSASHSTLLMPVAHNMSVMLDTIQQKLNASEMRRT